MNLRFVAIALAAVVPALWNGSNAQENNWHKLIINEVMQSTHSTRELDLLMEYPDGWVELYNPGDDPVSLKDWRIGKKSKYKKGYELPDIEIPANGYFVVYCDKSDTVVTANGITEVHADFRITTDTVSYIYLFDSQKGIADSVELPKMFVPDVAYGRETDGADKWGYELKVTKGGSNTGGLAIAILPQPFLTPSSYISTDAEQEPGSTGTALQVRHMTDLSLVCSNGEPVPDEAVCHYTLNGTEPTLDSPVLEQSAFKGLFIRHNTQIKASLFMEGYITPPAESHLYLLHGRKLAIPTVALSVNNEDLLNAEYGIFENQPKNSDEAHDKSLMKNWRRPAQFQYFNASGGEPRMTRLCEIRVGGAYTRINKLKSLIVYADKRFDGNDLFDYNFWNATKKGIAGVPSLGLRASGNDFGNSYMRDGIAQIMIGTYTDVDWQGYQPAIYYINTEYKGVINIRERANEDNVWTHYDGLEDITLVEITSKQQRGELKEGNYQDYSDFLDWCIDSINHHTLAEYEERMDVVEYTNAMICHIFFGNTDFPANNVIVWKPNTPEGRWRWILKDVDRAFGLWNFCPADGESLKWILREPNNITSDNEHNSALATATFRNLINYVPEYRDLFIDRLSVYMGDFLTSANMNSWIKWAHDLMATEQPYFKEGMSSNWNNEVENMKKWGAARIPSMYKQLQERFELGDIIPAKVNNGVKKMDCKYYRVSVNGVPLTEAKLNGSLYTQREYVFEGRHTRNGYEILGWNLTETVNGVERKTTLWGSTVSYTPDATVTAFSIDAIGGVSGVESYDNDLLEIKNIIYYNTAGVPSDNPYKGLNIVRYIYEDGSMSTEKQYME